MLENQRLPKHRFLRSAKGAVSRRHAMKELSIKVARTRPVLRVFLKSAKGAVSRHHAMKELSVKAARTRPVLRVFLKSPKGAVSRHQAMKELSVKVARTRPVLRVFLKRPKGRCLAPPCNEGTFRKGGANATRFARVPQKRYFSHSCIDRPPS